VVGDHNFLSGRSSPSWFCLRPSGLMATHYMASNAYYQSLSTSVALNPLPFLPILLPAVVNPRFTPVHAVNPGGLAADC
jgi:hypothetical protein